MIKFSRPDKKPLLVILVKRTISFFFGICVLLLFLYGIGTRQEFMNVTQIRLLQWIVSSGLFLSVACIYGVSLDLWFVFYKKREYKKSISYYIILGIFGFASAALGTFILALTGVLE